MSRLFILIKKKGAKKFIGAIPTRKGVSKEQIKRSANKQIKKGFSFSIITEKQLKSKFSSLIRRRNKKRKRKI